MPESNQLGGGGRFGAALEVGTTVIFSQDEMNPDGTRWRTVIRGWRSGEYVLLDLAPGQQTLPILRSNQPCELRFVAHGTAKGMESQVLDYGAGAYRSYFRVAWPKRISSVKLRKAPRIQTRLPCLLVDETGQEHEGEVLDLSALGCRVRTRRIVMAGTEVRLSFTLPDGTRLENAKAIVRNAGMAGSQANLGCQLLADDPEVTRGIALCVAATLDRHQGTPPSRRRVVIVDPDPAGHVQPLREALQEASYEVFEVTDALDAVFLSRVSMPAAVLANLEAKDIGGVELCHLMRRKPVFKELPFFSYSTGGKESPAQAGPDGVNGHFGSISDPAAIVKTLLECAPPPPETECEAGPEDHEDHPNGPDVEDAAQAHMTNGAAGAAEHMDSPPETGGADTPETEAANEKTEANEEQTGDTTEAGAGAEEDESPKGDATASR